MHCKQYSRAAVLAMSVLPLVAHAHDGHSNTPVHALLHMLESNGIWIGLLLVAGIGSLAYRAYKSGLGQGMTSKKRRGNHDAR